MEVLADLLNDFTGWLTIGVVGFAIVMMFFLIAMFISKSSGKS